MGLPHSFYLLAALQWGILAPLNLIKVLRNKPSPVAHHFVPAETEQCQKDCGIAQMWATLFWASQCALSAGFLHIYLYRSAKVPLIPIAAMQKIVVGILLIRAYKNGVVHCPPAVGGVIDIVVGCIFLLDVSLPPGPASEDSSPKKTSTFKQILEYLLRFAGRPWYPWVVGALSGINNFTMVLSGPLVVLFISGVLANPSQRRITAFANAVGTTVGVAVLVYLLSQNKTYIEDKFPQVFETRTWEITSSWVEEYGAIGALLISILPVFLQPLVSLCVLGGEMHSLVLLGAVLVGRTIKYIIMAELAVTGDKRLRYFGSAAVVAAESYKRKKTE